MNGLEMTKPILLIPVISVLLGCGMFTQADAPVSRGVAAAGVCLLSSPTIRLEKAGWSSADFWLRRQTSYGLAQARKGEEKIQVERYQPQPTA